MPMDGSGAGALFAFYRTTALYAVRYYPLTALLMLDQQSAFKGIEVIREMRNPEAEDSG